MEKIERLVQRTERTLGMTVGSRLSVENFWKEPSECIHAEVLEDFNSN